MLDELKSMGMQTLQLDVTSQESIKAAVEHIEDADSRIDVLVCNAGHWPFHDHCGTLLVMGSVMVRTS